MPAFPGTLTSYKYRDVPFAIWFDREKIAWCLDVREVGRVYPPAQGKVVCNLPNAAQAVLVGKQLIENVWRASRMPPALPEPRRERLLPPGPPSPPIQLPPIPPPLRGQYKGVFQSRLVAVHQAVQDLAQNRRFTVRQLANRLAMSTMQAARVVRELELRGYVRFVPTRRAPRGRIGYFVLTNEGRQWAERELTPVVHVRAQFEQAWREAIKMMGPVTEFTTKDLTQQLAAQRGEVVTSTTARRAHGTLQRLQQLGYVRFARRQPLPGGDSYVNVFALTPEGQQWLQSTENPIERGWMKPAALAAVILGVGLLTAGIASKLLSSTPAAPPTIASQLGAAALQDAQSDVGVTETSTNSGPRVDQMLANVGVNVPANWCAAAVSTWIFEGASMLGVMRPIAGSASVVALMNQFQDASNPRVGFLHASYLRAHPEAVTPGMVMILNRGGTGSGLGHTGIVEKNLGGGKYATIEGNSGPNSDSVVRNQRDLSAEMFIGMGVLKDVVGYQLGVGYLPDPPDAAIFATVGVSGPPLGTVSVNFLPQGLWVEVELARTPAEREEGLSHRASLPRNRGMLFDFGVSGDHAFWMYETAMPLDVIFADESFTIVGIVENMQPGDLTLRRIGRPSRYALEVNAGFVRDNGIQVGQHMGYAVV